MEETKKYKHSTASPAHNRATAKYNKANTKQYQIRLNLKTDSDLIAKIESVPNKLGYIKQLIRDDIQRGNG